MREHASKALTTARASHGARLTDEEFPISDWWTQLPFVVTQIPDSWEGFDIADEVLYESLQQFETEVRSSCATRSFHGAVLIVHHEGGGV